MRSFKNRQRYLALALTFLMPIYPNSELFSKTHQNILLVSEKINSREDAFKEIDRLVKITEKAQKNKKFNKAISNLKKIIHLERKFLGNNHPDLADTFTWIADIYSYENNFEKANIFYTSALEVRKIDDPEISIAINNLALNYQDQGQYDKAEPLFLRALNINEENDKPEISTAINNLALNYQYQGQYDKAEPLFLRALKIDEENDEPEISIVINNLALNYHNQGQYDKAEPLFLRALNINEELFGRNHPKTSLVLHNLASLYRDKGLLKKSQKLFIRALEIDKKTLGPQHPDTITTIGSLGEIYQSQALYKKAESLLIESLELSKKVLGPEHPETSIAFSKLGSLYHKQGFYNQAEQLYQRALKIDEKVFGKNSSLLADRLNDLGVINLDKGSLKKSETFLLRALLILDKSTDSINPALEVNLYNLGALNFELGLSIKAEKYFLRAIEITENNLGNEHPDLSRSLQFLGMIYMDQGLYDKAEPFLLRSLSINEKTLGPNHPDTSDSLDRLASLYQDQGLYEKAKPLFIRALAIDEKVYESDHPSISTKLNNLGLLYMDQGLYDEAELVLLRSLDISEKKFGSENSSTATNLNNLGLLYLEKGFHKKAKPLFIRALEIDEKTFGTLHPLVSIASSNLALLYEDQAIYEKGEPFARKTLEIEFTLIQRDSPYLALSERQLFSESFGNTYERAFSYAWHGEKGKKLALFSRLNKQGLLEEIEKRQAKFSMLPGPQKIVSKKLREVTQKISSKDLSIEERKKLKKEKDNLERKLYRLLPELKPRIVSVSEVADVIPEDGILIEFIKYSPFNGANSGYEKWEGERYLALTLSKDERIEVIDLGLAETIENKIKIAIKASEEVLIDAQELWDEVGKLVLKPLEEIIDQKKILFISPDAELNRIPFAAINSFEDNNLFANINLRLLTTGRELIELSKKSKNLNKNSLVVANPNFDKRMNHISKDSSTSIKPFSTQQRSGDFTTLSWEPLPGTSKEGQIISKITNGELLEKDKATSLAIQQKISPKILHIASHAYFMPDKKGLENPLLRSGIVLAGANQPNLNPNDDGYLLALEVAKLEWQGTEMAVISGCESGKGDIQSGEGVYGLKRAIAVAGARSSLLSLWKVNDNATAAFMESFYKKLINKEGRADALAATQKEFKIHPIKAWRHPNVWAAFQLSGDWRAIDF